MLLWMVDFNLLGIWISADRQDVGLQLPFGLANFKQILWERYNPSTAGRLVTRVIRCSGTHFWTVCMKKTPNIHVIGSCYQSRIIDVKRKVFAGEVLSSLASLNTCFRIVAAGTLILKASRIVCSRDNIATYSHSLGIIWIIFIHILAASNCRGWEIY